VKFIFATTEVRKVPVTVLSRCQRFDLRRIETGELVAHLAAIAGKEKVSVDQAALALIARAAEGSVRDALSLLDQAIAHAEDKSIDAAMVREMLGLADRGRVLDLFEKTMAGQIAEALAELKELHDRGADPLAVIQDLLEIVHFLTRLKIAPGAEGFFDGGSGEAKRSLEMAQKLSVPSLTRAWQMLLKGLLEVRDATRPSQAAEMALIRLAYAADLPPTDKLVRDFLDGDAATRHSPAKPSAGTMTNAPRASATTARALPAEAPSAIAQSAPILANLEDIVALAQANGAVALKVQLENYVHLVHLEPGKIEFRPDNRAPPTLAGDLAQRLKDWTGTRWVITLAREGGQPTLSEQKRAAKAQRLESVLQEPMVRAVLDRFPGAQVVAVRDIQPDAGLPSEEPEEPERDA